MITHLKTVSIGNPSISLPLKYMCQLIQNPGQNRHNCDTLILRQLRNLESEFHSVQQQREFNQLILAIIDPENSIKMPDGGAVICEDFKFNAKVLENLSAFHRAYNLSATDAIRFNNLVSASKEINLLVESGNITSSELGRLYKHLFAGDLPELSTLLLKEQLARETLRGQDAEIFLNKTLEYILTNTSIPSHHLERVQICVPPLSESARKGLDILHTALLPHEPSKLSVETKYLNVILALSKFRVSAHVLDILIPKGSSGDALDKKVDKLHEAIKIPIQGMLQDIRAKASATSEDDKQRWQFTEQRVGEVAEQLSTRMINGNPRAKIAEVIEMQRREWAETCSVGVDQQAIDFKGRIGAILSPSRDLAESIKKEKLFHRLVPAIQFRLQEMIAMVLPVDFAIDSHHINLLMKNIYTHQGVSVPSNLNDPYEVGNPEPINNNIDMLGKKFESPTWLFDGIIGIYQNHDQVETVLSDAIAKFGNIIHWDGSVGLVSPEARLSAIEATMMGMPNLFLETKKNAPELIDSLNVQIGGHGLTGLAAKAGCFDVFCNVVTGQLNQSNFSIYSRDGYGCTLLDYAALGGNVDVFEFVFNISSEKWGIAINSSTQIQTMPSLLAMAAESGNRAMVDIVASKFGAQTTLMLSVTDGRGYTPLMHAVLAGNRDVVDAIFNLDEGIVTSGINAYNNDGQTPLILAITHAKSSEIVSFLLEKGADPNIRIRTQTGVLKDTPLYLAGLEGDPQIFSLILMDVRTIPKFVAIKSISDLLPGILVQIPDRVKAILELKDKGGITVAHWLVENKASVLKEVLANNPEQMMDILGLKDSEGSTVALYLADHNATSLKTILSDHPKHLMNVLMLETVGCMISHWLAQKGGAVLKEILASYPERVMEILNLTDSDGRKVAHWLTGCNQTSGNDYPPCALKEILADNSEHLMDILRLPDKDGDTVAYFLGYYNSAVLIEILADHSDHLIDILGLTGENGDTLLAMLAKSDGIALKEILAEHPAHVVDILGLKGSEGETVARSLAEVDAPFLKEILADHPAHVVDILGLKDPKGFPVVCCVKNLNVKSLHEILADHPDHVVGILGLKIPKGDPFAHWLAKTDAGILMEILAHHPNHAVNILGLKDQEGYPVVYYIAEFNVKFLHEILADHPDHVMEILGLKDPQGNNFARMLASSHGKTLKEILAHHPNDAVNILGLKDQEGYPVVFYIAEFKLKLLHEILADHPDHVMEILGLKDTQGNTVACGLATSHGKTLKEILEHHPNHVKEILGLKDQEGYPIVCYVAEFNVQLLHEVLADHPGHLMEILGLKDTQGNTFARGLATFHGKTLKEILAHHPNHAMNILGWTDEQGDTIAYYLAQHQFTEFKALLGAIGVIKILTIVDNQGTQLISFLNKAQLREIIDEFPRQEGSINRIYKTTCGSCVVV